MPDPFLTKLPAFKKLPAPALAELSRTLTLRRYRKGEAVFEEGSAADAVHLLKSGVLKAVKFSPRSDYASMELIGPGQLFGMIAVLDDKPYPVSAVPITPCEAYRIP
ncbi:MAG: cyclic nucleotide-binding domain-containing protein, partial [Elusimicrobia bacterium]|nr:cyclic nucleotide-binding domain-containing protein [Elusimicrobiota bacterium]